MTKDKKAREVFKIIKNNPTITQELLSQELSVTQRSIANYISYLKDGLNVGIQYNRKEQRYEIFSEGDLEVLKSNRQMDEDQISMLLFSLIQSSAFMPVQIEKIKSILLKELSSYDSECLRKILPNDEGCSLTETAFAENNFKAIRGSILKKQGIVFSYKLSNGLIKNRVEAIPLSFGYDFGKYYVIAILDRDEREFRHFRIDRMRNIETYEINSNRLFDYDPQKYHKRTWYMYTGKEIRVRVKFDSKCYAVVKERNMKDGTLISRTKEDFIYEFIANGTNGIKLWILGFGSDAEVLEPIELRDEIKEIAQKMIERYNL